MPQSASITEHWSYLIKVLHSVTFCSPEARWILYALWPHTSRGQHTTVVLNTQNHSFQSRWHPPHKSTGTRSSLTMPHRTLLSKALMLTLLLEGVSYKFMWPGTVVSINFYRDNIEEDWEFTVIPHVLLPQTLEKISKQRQTLVEAISNDFNTHVHVYLPKHLINKVNISSGGQEDPLHHLIHSPMLLLDAAEAWITEPPVRQRAAIGMASLLLACIRHTGFQFRVFILVYNTNSLHRKDIANYITEVLHSKNLWCLLRAQDSSIHFHKAHRHPSSQNEQFSIYLLKQQGISSYMLYDAYFLWVPCSWLTCLLPKKERGRGVVVGLESWQAQGRSSSKPIGFLRKEGSHHYTRCIFLGITIPHSSLSDIVLAWHCIYFATFHPEPRLTKIIQSREDRGQSLWKKVNKTASELLDKECYSH